MKKPSIINIKKFFLSLGLFDQSGVSNNVYAPQELKDFDHLYINIVDISHQSVDALLLCPVKEALSSIQKETGLSPKEIKIPDCHLWRFTFPNLGYVSIEEKSSSILITIDNGI